MWGIWSFGRQDWMLDPMSDDDPPPPLKFETVMDAIKCATGYHKAMQCFPIRFAADGTPNQQDIKALDL